MFRIYHGSLWLSSRGWSARKLTGLAVCLLSILVLPSCGSGRLSNGDAIDGYKVSQAAFDQYVQRHQLMTPNIDLGTARGRLHADLAKIDPMQPRSLDLFFAWRGRWDAKPSSYNGSVLGHWLDVTGTPYKRGYSITTRCPGIVEWIDRVMRLTAKRIRFLVVRDVRLFGGSHANGAIIVSTGLIRRLRHQNELLAVLAHEVAHVLLKHHIDANLERRHLKYYKSKSQRWWGVYFQGFSAKREATADVLAMDILDWSGVHFLYLGRAMEAFGDARTRVDYINNAAAGEERKLRLSHAPIGMRQSNMSSYFKARSSWKDFRECEADDNWQRSAILVGSKRYEISKDVLLFHQY